MCHQHVAGFLARFALVQHFPESMALAHQSLATSLPLDCIELVQYYCTSYYSNVAVGHRYTTAHCWSSFHMAHMVFAAVLQMAMVQALVFVQLC